MASLLYLTPLLVALLAPGSAVLAGCRLRVVIAVVFVPLVVVVLAALISAPTGWGQTRHPEDDGLTNTAGLLYLIFYTVVAQLAGIVVAVVAAGVSRLVGPRAAGSA
ncbi:MAG TPA: hypothetical protein VGF46_11085 [Gaiellales bacterium]|jgi:hypothetical protein